MISNATLVYDASTSFPSAGWRAIDIADFVYGTGNLLVLCETNYGGSGATFYPAFRYSYFPAKHQYWYEYDYPPPGNGTVNENRPNIQIIYTALTGPVAPPSGFMALAAGPAQINFTWKKNLASDPVMIAFNTVNVFGTPAGNYIVGGNLSGGGTVIYSGTGTTYSQTTGLNPGTTYYYKAWSVHPSVPTYSPGTCAQASTLCGVVDELPYLTDFEEVLFPPSCWTVSGLPWQQSTVASGYGSGSHSAYADFFNTSIGDFELVSPELDFGTVVTTSVTFDHAYATYSTQEDKLELWTSADQGATYILLATWLGGLAGPLNTGGATVTAFVPNASQWATKTFPLPAGTTRIMFRGVSSYGNNLFIDNIRFTGACPGPEEPYAGDLTSSSAGLGWTPAGPATTWDVLWDVEGFDTLTGGSLVTGIAGIPFLLEGLQSGTDYAYYVRSNCGVSNSFWEGPVLFSTLCMTSEVPFYESFDFLVAPATGCNIVSDNNLDAIRWVTSELLPQTFPNSMQISQSSLLATDDWFFSPGINLEEGITYRLNFSYFSDGAGATDKLEVKWGEGQEAASMTGGILWQDQNIQATTYTEANATLTPGAGGTFYFGWHCFSGTGAGSLFVDDVQIFPASLSWNGSISDEWENPENWTPGTVPMGLQDAVIPGGTLNQPTIYYSGNECRNLTIEAGANLVVATEAELIVNGNLLLRPNGSLNNYGYITILGNLENQNTE
jgi:hypothetical protein